MKRYSPAIVCVLLFALGGCSGKRSVDLIVHHGVVYTVDSSFSTVTAFAVADGKIVATGSEQDILDHYTAKETRDAGGHAVYPGLIDAHAHFVGYGQELFTADLFGAASWDEVLVRLQAFAKAHPDEPWVLGRGWDQNRWPGKQFPSNEKLSSLFPGRPVFLTRVDGHAAMVNQKAFELAGVLPGASLSGGRVETKQGKLTGLLVDNAMGLVASKIPALSAAAYTQRLLAAQKNCFAQGLTTVADCGLSYLDVSAIDSLQQSGQLLMRMYILLSDDSANFRRFLPKGPYHTDRMFVKGFKFYADGALGSRGACLLEPYNDQPGWHGFLRSSIRHFDSMATILAGTDFQMCTHAIGDSGNRMILTIYNKVLKTKNDKRWRIEHAQVIAPEDFELFGKTSVIPSVQPTHATSDMYWAGERLGAERLKGAYAYRQLLLQNGWMPLGTDFPVEDISPFKTFFAAVIRKDAKGFPAGGFQPENALTRIEAIRGMTCWAAKGCFLEKEVGSLEAGKKADFIILDRDLMKAPEQQLLGAQVLATYSGGRLVSGTGQ